MITLEDVADKARLERILNPRRTKAWSNAGLRNPPIDGVDTYDFFTGPTSCLNAKKVTDAILAMNPWAPLVQDPIAKSPPLKDVVAQAKGAGRIYNAIGSTYTSPTSTSTGSRIYTAPEWTPNGSREERIYSGGPRENIRASRIYKRQHRLVNHDTRVDHARQLALKDILLPLIEGKLSRVAVAYVRGRRLDDVFVRALMTIRESKLLFTKTLDVQGCFDAVDWNILDRCIDRHISTTVDENVRSLLKASYKATAYRRDGTKAERTKGIPQGSTLAALLINLYFTDCDRIVQRTIANFGCTLWRYCDDILVAAPSVEALQQATAVIQRELQRLRLSIKPETDHVCDLNNPENPGRWLGFAFTSHRTWVPRERVERKAASVLDMLIRGKVSPETIDDNLAALHQHYAHVLHEDDAQKAISSIRKLIAPYLKVATKKKEGIEQIRKQIEKRVSSRWSKPALGGDANKGTTLTGRMPLANDRAFGLGREREGNLSAKGSAYSRDGEVRGEARTSRRFVGTPPEGRGFVRDGKRSVGETHAVQEREGLVNSRSNLLPLEALRNSEAPPLVDQAAHRRGASDKIIFRDVYTATIKVAPSKCEWGDLRVAYSNGTSWSSPFRVKRAASQEEIVLAGYQLGLRRALLAGARRVAFFTKQRTIDGYLERGYRIRSVYVMRQWERLLRDVDDLHGVEVGSTDHRGNWSSWSVQVDVRAIGVNAPV